MGNKESNESAAVKRQAEGFSNPMYAMLDLGVSKIPDWNSIKHVLFPSGWRAILGAVQEGHGYW